MNGTYVAIRPTLFAPNGFEATVVVGDPLGTTTLYIGPANEAVNVAAQVAQQLDAFLVPPMIAQEV